MNASVMRAFTTPLPSQPRLHTSNSSSNVPTVGQINHHDSHNSTNSQPSRSSDSTQNTSASTLFSPSGPAPSFSSSSSTVVASDNVINRTADKGESLFQRCVTLRARLAGVPGFEEQIMEVEEDLEDPDLDPVVLLWNVFRKGYPLMTIYNALSPEKPIWVDGATLSDSKAAQMGAYKFIQGCLRELHFDPSECFMTMDLKGTERDINMSGFDKVVRVVNRVVDLLEDKGVIQAFDGYDQEHNFTANPKKTHAQNVVEELVRTERTYVQHLELLQGFSRHVRQQATITGDAVHDIFLNLDDLLEFQRRFLVRVEQTNAQIDTEQNWGRLFTTFAGSGSGAVDNTKNFRVYEPFIENHKRCEETTMKEFDKLRNVGGPLEFRQMVESPTNLTGFLLKPFQRLSKYPLILKELRDKGDMDDDRKEELTQAIESITTILYRTNASLDREDRLEAVKALKGQVEDWKSHRVEAFGDLLLYGTHTVLKGDISGNEREYRMYLFEKILLCCKEINLNKQKNKLRPSAQPDRKGRPKLQLKGRIFMQNVTSTVPDTKPGSYTCQIYWRGDDTVEHFTIRFTTEEMMKRWRDRIEEQRTACREEAQRTVLPSNDLHPVTHPHRPEHHVYPDEDLLDEGDGNGVLHRHTDSSLLGGSRNNSQTSLRSRSTTGESGPPLGASSTPRNQRPTVAQLNLPPALAIRTAPGQPPMSPTEKAGGSYFSPSNESPASNRTSSSSNFPFPRPGGGTTNYYHEERSRFTAPAQPSNSRDVQGNAYTKASHLSHEPARPRAYSNPSLQNAMRRNNTTNNGAAPPVPSVPAHYSGVPAGVVNRSQSNSPMSPESKRSHQSQPRGYFADGSVQHQEDSRGDYDPFASDRTPVIGSPPMGSYPSGDGEYTPPSQLKIKVKVPAEGCTMTLVVGFNISFQMLKERIDAKLQRNTTMSLASGAQKLQYWDEDEYINIQTDEDVQTAFETWKERQADDIAGNLGEVELFIRPK